jgi:hypothetical protein
MIQNKELFSVSYIYFCNQIFQFTSNLQGNNRFVILQCSKCKEDTQITYDSNICSEIRKYL